MSGFRTKLTDIQDALKTAIENQSPGCPVDVGYPTGGRKPKHIWISGEATTTVAGHDSSMGTRQETGTLEVLCVTKKSGASYTTVRDETLALVDKIEDALAADRSLGGLVMSAVVVNGELSEAVDKEWREVGVVLRISTGGSVATG
jgi:hypothetical protein